ncbi:hypothetical protein KBC03_04905 [Patescibacteria group bacterium]|nr:hypothetical protein [Patescibacteria group bacterium]
MNVHIENTTSQQSLIDFIMKNDMKLLHIMHNIALLVKKEASNQVRSTKNSQNHYAIESLVIDYCGIVSEEREKQIREVFKLVSTSLRLSDILSVVDVYETPRWIRAGATHLLHSNLIKETVTTLQSRAAGENMFIAGDCAEIVPNEMNFRISLFALPNSILSSAGEIYEKYILLKQIGLVVGMAAYFCKRYQKQEGFREYMFTFPDNTTKLQGDDLMEKFVKQLEKEIFINDCYKVRHAGKNLPDDYVLDAFSDLFAAYYMGFIMLPEASEVVRLPRTLRMFLFNFIYSFITKPT